ncbi:GMC family oxidoreductase [Actinobacteria bacterium YIM 96077]|uniref:Oxidoreductase n=1 Tax=Phytoactinopolyspora halophila TaxID=1981511 RepID=A0A329QAM7_9ACTN|nr:GMC family oxidoreductase [Phytoactinopolyspora halophila]AYY12514.1 GMC family oxidoreductase [Actinobacteria bacterium YIM 96077]RAW09425.1 oxidoreductase [Phytoactinopolyspora halophila]
MPGRADVIVVGAGSAGCVVTRRLVDAGVRVVLLEAGGPDANPAIHDPSRMGELWHGPEDWDFYTVPQKHAAGRRLHLPRGRVLGGSHALNGMIWVRGCPHDFDHWAELGNPGWSWNDVLPIYAAIERRSGTGATSPGPPGIEGLLDVAPNLPLHPIQQSIVDAAMQLGLEFNPDYNDGELDGVSVQQVTMRAGQRVSTWSAYAAPVTGAPNLTVRTGAVVRRLLLAGTRVTGVEFEIGNRQHRVLADQVILCAGTIGSPAILLRSGIGPADELRAVGVDVAADLPGVGTNLHDHLLCPVIFGTTRRQVEPPRPGRSVTQTHLFWRSRSGLAVPDTQPIHFSVPMYEPWMQGPEAGFSLMAGMISPESRGRVRLSGARPHDELLIDLDALADERDVDSLAASVEQCREMGRSAALAGEWGAYELYPGPGVTGEAAVRDYVRRAAITYHHQVGTCTMGVHSMAVVDPSLRAHGVNGLRIADASVMPRVTTGNTNAPSILIGERAASFVLR